MTRKADENARHAKQYDHTTLIRVSKDLHARIRDLILPGESLQDVIYRAVSLLEAAGEDAPIINTCINDAVNDVHALVNAAVNEVINAEVKETLTALTTSVNDLTARLEALEANMSGGGSNLCRMCMFRLK